MMRRASVSLAEVAGARRAPFLARIKPMLANLAEGPFCHPDWLFEPKLDGYRAIALIHHRQVRLLSRRGPDMTNQFPMVVHDLASQVEPELVLDGEVVALDTTGRPSFQQLQGSQPRSFKGKPEPIGGRRATIVYYVFDLLYLNGFDLRDVALEERKMLLRDVLVPSDSVRVVEHFVGDGQAVYDAAILQGLEGVLAKYRYSTYTSGRRSRYWLKIKAVLSDDFVIGGYTQGRGHRAATFGALLLGYHDRHGRLVFAGHVGTGFSAKTLETLRNRLDTIRTDRCPFIMPPAGNAPTTWVRPEMIAEVNFAQYTRDGLLRAPAFVRLRQDKSSDQVKRAEIVPVSGRCPRPADARVPADTPMTAVVEQLREPGQRLMLEVGEAKVRLTNLDKHMWPAFGERPPITKRDLLVYLCRVSPYLLPHLQGRPLTLVRCPNGISGERLWQKHLERPLPDFVRTVSLSSKPTDASGEYVLCDNLATLMWLGQLASVELHTWLARVGPAEGASMRKLRSVTPREAIGTALLDCPDFLVFDLDPFIYAGREAPGAEPALSPEGFARTCEVAGWLKEILEHLGLHAFVKTSGATGLHIYVPIVPRLGYAAVKASCKAIAQFLIRAHPQDVTIDWPVALRTGKVFVDYGQNAREKTLAAPLSPRSLPRATVSMPLSWDRLQQAFPTHFTILTVPDLLAEIGDPWDGILSARRDLAKSF